MNEDEKLDNRILNVRIPVSGALFIHSVLSKYEKEIIKDCMNQGGLLEMQGGKLSIKVIKLCIAQAVNEPGIKGEQIANLIKQHNTKTDNNQKISGN